MPEFTQIDLEMSFVDMDDVIEFKELMKCKDSAAASYLEGGHGLYGSDKPDIKFGFELKKLNDVVAGCGFKVFTDALAAGGG